MWFLLNNLAMIIINKRLNKISQIIAECFCLILKFPFLYENYTLFNNITFGPVQGVIEIHPETKTSGS